MRRFVKVSTVLMKVMWTEHTLKNQARMDEVDLRPVRLKMCQNQMSLSVGMTLMTTVGCDSSCAKQEGKRNR